MYPFPILIPPRGYLTYQWLVDVLINIAYYRFQDWFVDIFIYPCKLTGDKFFASFHYRFYYWLYVWLVDFFIDPCGLITYKFFGSFYGRLKDRLVDFFVDPRTFASYKLLGFFNSWFENWL